MHTLRQPGLWLAFLLATGLLRYPQTAAEAVRQGGALCLQTLAPALFPFFVLSSLLISLGLGQALSRPMEGLMRPLFRLPGRTAPALILGLLGGYPVGARTIRQLYEQGSCTRRQAQSLLAFCNNAGPGFFLGVVGVGVFGSSRIGVYLWLIHLLAALLTGLLLRPSPGAEAYAAPPSLSPPIPFSAALTQAVSGSFTALLGVCAFVLFWFVALALLEQAGLLGGLTLLLCAAADCTPSHAVSLLRGLLELTAGVTGLPPDRGGFLLAAGLLGFGGLSVHGQTAAVLAGSGLSLGRHWLGKGVQALLSLLLALPVWPLL